MGEQAVSVLAADIQEWMGERRIGLIGIDGMCGSGKTTIAAALGEQLDIPVFHMDDYYLPFSRREKGWRDRCAGNMDLDRLEAEVLKPLSRGERVNTFRYNCRRNILTPDDRHPDSLAIVEGTYCLHPRIRSCFSFSIFVTVSEDVQRRRLEAREGSNFDNFLTTWIPMERHYFQVVHPELYADIRMELDADGRIVLYERRNSSQNE